MPRVTSENWVEAAEWFRRSAEQGHPDAQHSLGIMCSVGQGTRRSLVQAHMWLSLAAASRQGIHRARSIEARDAVSARMTPGQITKAKRLARRWHPTAESELPR